MARINSRASGKQGELMVAALLRAHGIPARRGQQFAGGNSSPDVMHGLDPILHLEVKWQNKTQLDAWYDQAVVDGTYRVAAVVHRKKARGPVTLPWLATTSLRDLAMLLGGEAEAFEHGSAHAVQARAFALRLHLDAAHTDALRFDERWAAATSGYAPSAPFAGRSPITHGLAHCRKPADSIWMVTLFAADLLEIALAWAARDYGYPLPVAEAANLEGEVEREVRRFWEGQRARLSQRLPLFAGGA